MPTINEITLSAEELRDAMLDFLEKKGLGKLDLAIENVVVKSHRQTVFDIDLFAGGKITFNDGETIHMVVGS